MRTRRLALLAVLATAVACGDAVPGGPADVLFIRAGSDITLVRDLAEPSTVTLPRAQPAIDWSAVVHAIPQGDSTRVVALDTGTGDAVWSRDIPDRLEVRAASAGGEVVALGPPRERSGYAIGRSSTTLVIASATEPPRTIELEGNYQPEAFSTDNQSLFVVEYLPPLRPDRYRVRRLDLGTEEVVGVYTPDEDLQTAMQGTARIQASSRDGRRLYTLYTVDGPGGTSRSFIHVLSLDELWAHCIDLPAEFASSRESSIGLALDPSGTRLYVADTRSGNIAEIDTAYLTVARTAALPSERTGGGTELAAGADGRVYLAKAGVLQVIDRADLSVAETLRLDGRITGLQPSRDGSRLYVGLRNRIAVVDTSTTPEVLPTPLDAGDIGEIDQLGDATRVVDEARDVIKCAC